MRFLSPKKILVIERKTLAMVLENWSIGYSPDHIKWGQEMSLLSFGLEIIDPPLELFAYFSR